MKINFYYNRYIKGGIMMFSDTYTEEEIENFGEYFIENHIRERFNITFITFLYLIKNNRWTEK
jgi:hypothetical protein